MLPATLSAVARQFAARPCSGPFARGQGFRQASPQRSLSPWPCRQAGRYRLLRPDGASGRVRIHAAPPHALSSPGFQRGLPQGGAAGQTNDACWLGLPALEQPASETGIQRPSKVSCVSVWLRQDRSAIRTPPRHIGPYQPILDSIKHHCSQHFGPKSPTPDAPKRCERATNNAIRSMVRLYRMDASRPADVCENLLAAKQSVISDPARSVPNPFHRGNHWPRFKACAGRPEPVSGHALRPPLACRLKVYGAGSRNWNPVPAIDGGAGCRSRLPRRQALRRASGSWDGHGAAMYPPLARSPRSETDADGCSSALPRGCIPFRGGWGYPSARFRRAPTCRVRPPGVVPARRDLQQDRGNRRMAGIAGSRVAIRRRPAAAATRGCRTVSRQGAESLVALLRRFAARPCPGSTIPAELSRPGHGRCRIAWSDCWRTQCSDPRPRQSTS